jgi:hypothetical protein
MPVSNPVRTPQCAHGKGSVRLRIATAIGNPSTARGHRMLWQVAAGPGMRQAPAQGMPSKRRASPMVPVDVTGARAHHRFVVLPVNKQLERFESDELGGPWQRECPTA